MLTQSIKMAYKSITANKVRLFLTMLGIIVGVVALIVLVSIVDSTTSSVTDTINNIGNNTLTVKISDDKGKPMKLDDVFSLSKKEEIEKVSPVANASLTVSCNSTSETATAYGVTNDYGEINDIELRSGRFIKNIDVKNNSNVAVVSSDIATEIIGNFDVEGKTIRINNMSYQVIGVTKEKSSSSSSNSVYEVYIPYTSLIRASDSVSSNVTNFVVTAKDKESIDYANTELTKYMNKRFDNDEDAYNIISASSVQDAVNDVSSQLSLLLAGIAAISLLVAGIGIMNIMLVSVMERIKEIGLRKAVGATKKDIMSQFIIESFFISFFGAMLGVILSVIIIKVIGIVGTSTGTTTQFAISVKAVVLSSIFSIIVGVLFGIYPANKAANMDPIEALRSS